MLNMILFETINFILYLKSLSISQQKSTNLFSRNFFILALVIQESSETIENNFLLKFRLNKESVKRSKRDLQSNSHKIEFSNTDFKGILKNKTI